MGQKKYINPLFFYLMVVGLSVWLVPEKQTTAEIPDIRRIGACSQASDMLGLVSVQRFFGAMCGFPVPSQRNMRQKKYVNPILFRLMAVGFPIMWIVHEKLAVAEMPEPTMMACNQDSDCVLVNKDCYGCNHGEGMKAVHIDQRAEYEKLWKQKCAHLNIFRLLQTRSRDRHRCNEFSVQCVDSQCQATEKGFWKLLNKVEDFLVVSLILVILLLIVFLATARDRNTRPHPHRRFRPKLY